MSAPGQVAVVFGASGGIGTALVERLVASARYSTIWAGARRPGVGSDSCSFRFDLTDETSIVDAAARIGGPVDLVLVATGLLHDDEVQPEKSVRAVDAASMARAFQVNAIGPALIAKHFAPLLPRDRRATFAALSARVASIGDNRLGGWYAYRASKAALNMTVAAAQADYPQAILVAMNPGWVQTDMGGKSAPLTPAQSVSGMRQVIAALSPEETGTFKDYSGKAIAW